MKKDPIEAFVDGVVAVLRSLVDAREHTQEDYALVGPGGCDA